MSEPTYLYVGSYILNVGIFHVLLVCRKGETESGGIWRAYAGSGGMKLYLGRWSRRASHPFNHGAGHGGMPQVDDVICLHHTADRSGTGEQGTSMERLPCLWQRIPGLSGADGCQVWPQWLIRSTHVSPNYVPWVSLYKEHQGLLLRGRL